jgi:hypothetical protein
MKVWLDVLLYSGIGMVCMFFRDILATVLTAAIAKGHHKLAGNMDGISDIINIILAAYSGVQLIKLGWPGWIGILPIGIVGKFTTEIATKWQHKNINDAPIEKD